MLNRYLPPSHIQILESVSDWQNAVRQAAQPLLTEGAIELRYIEHIIQLHKEIGPYYVIAPQIAMPHSRPEDGAKAQALSLLVIKQGVTFGSENDPVKLVLLLAATDNSSHLAMLSALGELFSVQENIDKLIQATTLDEITAVIQQY